MVATPAHTADAHNSAIIARLRSSVLSASAMDNPPQAVGSGWNSYADKFSTLESANPPPVPGHLSLEPASPYRNVDDTHEGKEVWDPESAPKGAAFVESRRICGLSVKAAMILGVVLLLVVVGGTVGAVVGSRKGNSGNSAAAAAVETSMTPQSTGSPLAASETTEGDASSATDFLSTDATDAINSAEPTPTSSTEETAEPDAEPATASTIDPEPATPATETPEPEPPSTTPDTPNPNPNPTTTKNPPSPPPPKATPTPSPPTSIAPSNPKPVQDSSISFAPNKFYTIKGANDIYIRAIDRGSTPGVWSVIAEAQPNGPTALENQWQLFDVPSDNPKSAYQGSATFWISNRYYGPDRPLTLDAGDWGSKKSGGVIPLPPKKRDEEDEGMYWFFEQSEGGMKMHNVKSGTDYRVVMSPEGLGVAGEEVKGGGVVEDWGVEERDEIKKGGDGWDWVTG